MQSDCSPALLPHRPGHYTIAPYTAARAGYKLTTFGNFHGLGSDVLGLAVLVLGDIPLDLQLLGGDGFLQRPVELPVAAVGPDLVETLPADDVELIVPKGVIVVLAVGLDFAVCPAYDDLQAVQGDIRQLVEGVNHDADNLGTVGEVDVRIVALTAAHCPGVDGVPVRHIFGDGGGVLLVDVGIVHLRDLPQNCRFNVK